MGKGFSENFNKNKNKPITGQVRNVKSDDIPKQHGLKCKAYFLSSKAESTHTPGSKKHEGSINK
jgi:hypothetical protein